VTLRRSLAVGSCGLLSAQWLPAAAVASPAVARLLGIRTTLPSERGVLLTFDDGPHPRGTPAVLRALGRAGAPAVFFVSGEQAATFPGLVGEIVAAGHEVALHGYRHQTRRQWTRRLLADDTRRALEAISRAAAVVPRLYRPPHGVVSATGLLLVRSLGLTPLLWSRWGRDWQGRATASTVARRATDGIRAGDVVLLHDADHYGAPDSWRTTVAALPLILARVEAAGLEPASVRSRPGGIGLALAC
jgi:peptidoglycan-N-acetylglucosamine deacetylase